MTETARSWTPQDVLWELGASFVDATAETADAVIVTTMERVARLMNGSTAGIWRLDHRTMTSVNIHQWSIDASSGLDRDASVSPDPTVREAVLAGGGIGVVAVELIVGKEVATDRGWVGSEAVVAVIDENPSDTIVLVVAAGGANWDDVDFELVRGTVLLLRQFNHRVRAERRLHERHQLDALTAALAARLQSVSPDTVDDEVERALVSIGEIVRAESVVLIDVVDEQTIQLPYLVSAGSLDEELRTLTLPEISNLPGGAGLTLREYIAEPRVAALADLVDAIMGVEMSEALGLHTSRRSVAMLPASVASGHAVLAVTRPGDGDWLPEEFDALSTLASILAQTRGRVAAERSSTERLDAQRALAATGRVFLEANRESAARARHETLERMGGHLGADLAVIASMGADNETVTIVDAWSRTGAAPLREGHTVNRNAMELIDEMLVDDPETRVRQATGDLAPFLRDSPDGKWTTVLAPIRGAGLAPSGLAFVWAGDRSGDPAPAQDLANATADLIGQFDVRLRAEEEVNARLRIDEILSELADDFLGASHESAGEVIERAVERFGSAMGMRGLSLGGLEGTSAVVEAAWSPDGSPRPAVGDRVEAGADMTPADIDRFQQGQIGPEWEEWRSRQWGPGVAVTVLPVLVGGKVDALLGLAGVTAIVGHEGEAFRSFAIMLGQFRSRVAEERRGLRRLAAQRLLSRCAAELAETTPDSFQDVVITVLGEAAAFCELEAIIDWRIDHRSKRYVRGAWWISPEHAEEWTDSSAPWGEWPLIDQVRRTGELSMLGAEDPTFAGLSRLAIPRGEVGSVDQVLLCVSSRTDPWNDEVVELLTSLSRMIQEVDARVAAQRYAQAAFEDAPIGIVLRDEALELITCNQAFVEFVGAGSVDELVGTRPEDLYDPAAPPVEWHDQPGGLRSAEAAFRGRAGSQVWGQMRSSIVQGDRGEHFWLVHIEDVTERRRAEQLLRFQASHDELTGLANRRRLLEEIHRLAAGCESVAVLLLDLDRFKIINDSLGHDRGDELLVVIADRLRLAVRPGDLVARLGGDEFAVVLPGPVVGADAEFVAERLLRLIGEPVVLGNQKIYPSASIGIAVADASTAIEDLLRRADTAMYRAKAQGRSRSESFDEELRDEVTARMATESGLRGALRSQELLVHYQPEVSLRDGGLLGAEALVRWRHPVQGLLPACDFIEIAEETGLIVEIGDVVLTEACREAARWPGGDDGPMVRVNLAAAQLQREATVDLVGSVLAETGLHPSRLCLEITESAVMSDVNRSEEILHRLKAIGVRLAVDDFGTGFSSLAYLKRFPVDALKIDRAFIKDLGRNDEDEAFVRSIVSLAEALGLDVVAEGVETQLQADMLLQLGCHRAQGFLFARPGPASELGSRLRDYAG